MSGRSDTLTGVFQRITARPHLTLGASLVLIVLLASGLATLVKDTSVKAFIPPDHPALIADANVADVFGVSDAIAIAVVDRDGSVFSPSTLRLVADLTETIATLPNINAERLFSLATESSITGSDGSIDVTPYIEAADLSDASAANAARRWRDMPPHIGTLVSADEHGTVILAPVNDPAVADETYLAVMAAIDSIAVDDVEIMVAGPGAVSGYLSRYIDEDARKLQPLVFLTVLGFIYFAFRRLSVLPGALVVVIGAAGGALGLMAWSDTPYYAITNALPVIIVAISVADAIHVLSVYFQLRASRVDAPASDLVVDAMATMARPITLTTITTIAGFVGIAVASIMPPVTAFGVYAAVGAALAWVFTMTALPNVLVLLKPKPSPSFASFAAGRPSGLGLALARGGAIAARHYRLTLLAFLIVVSVAAIGAARLQIDRSQVDNFASDEPIRLADTTINELFAGTAFVDVIIEAPDGLLDTARMRRIVEFQRYIESLPHVQTSVGITDYLGLMHAAIEETPITAANARQLPSAADSLAQYLLLYEVSGDPGDFDDEIDYAYERALIRGVMNTHYYSDTAPVVEALQRYIDAEFDDESLTATLAGDVTVSYHWMSRLERSHFVSVGLSLVLVLVTSIVVFRSVTLGCIAVVPVSFAVLVLYAVMGFAGVYLEPATSMFAAIAIGVGVDFGVHLVDRVIQKDNLRGAALADHLHATLAPTARACFFNSAALGLGFAVLMTSHLPTLQRFGALVAVAAVSSYIVALILVPALIAARAALRDYLKLRMPRWSAPAVIVLLTCTAVSFAAREAKSDDAPAVALDALAIAERVANRPVPPATHRHVAITLTNKRGRTRNRHAVIVALDDAEMEYTRITYTEPKAIRDTAFLSHDAIAASRADSRWLYIPASRRVRRIPASDRGDYFLGTDFTYEDIQSELKFELDDYRFSDARTISHGGEQQIRIAGQPKSAAIARELGYGRFEAVIDTLTWMPLQIDFFDRQLRALKTVTVRRVEEIDGYWTATHIVAANHRTGHSTDFHSTDIRHLDALPTELFDAAQLNRGLDVALLQGND
ncbi:MAG: outer membrane lipoprotein-sorting protein [Pseudomonadota bacterium]